ncbi:MAG TPA: cytochrome c oxidase subunit 3 [Ktedonobacterales bacterium]|nr:cytochrome c oxidase subunit 3 [Ktedonobacterales bacterium]
MSTVVTPAETIHEEAQPHGRSVGWYGMVFFIASEAVFFANLIASYLYLRIRGGVCWNASQCPPGVVPATGTIELDKVLALVNTVILLSSSFPMHFAARAIEQGNRRRTVLLLLATIILGATFISIQAYEYLTNSFGPSTNVAGSVFYTLTGFHGAHVTAGLLLLTVCLVRTARGSVTKNKHFVLNAGEMYWHFVDVVWIFLMTLVYFFQ